MGVVETLRNLVYVNCTDHKNRGIDSAKQIKYADFEMFLFLASVVNRTWETTVLEVR